MLSGRFWLERTTPWRPAIPFPLWPWRMWQQCTSIDNFRRCISVSSLRLSAPPVSVIGEEMGWNWHSYRRRPLSAILSQIYPIITRHYVFLKANLTLFAKVWKADHGYFKSKCASFWTHQPSHDQHLAVNFYCHWPVAISTLYSIGVLCQVLHRSCWPSDCFW